MVARACADRGIAAILCAAILGCGPRVYHASDYQRLNCPGFRVVKIVNPTPVTLGVLEDSRPIGEVAPGGTASFSLDPKHQGLVRWMIQRPGGNAPVRQVSETTMRAVQMSIQCE